MSLFEDLSKNFYIIRNSMKNFKLMTVLIKAFIKSLSQKNPIKQDFTASEKAF